MLIINKFYGSYEGYENFKNRNWFVKYLFLLQCPWEPKNTASWVKLLSKLYSVEFFISLWGCRIQFSSVAQSCPTLCDPMNRSTPGLPVHHQLPEFTQLMSIESVMPSSHLILCYPLSSCPQSLPASGSFPMSQLFAWGGQSTGVSALASFLPKKSQGWSPSGWTGWISLQSKGLSRIFWGCIGLLKVLSPFSDLGIQGPSPQLLCSGKPVEVCKRRAFRQGSLC